MTRVLRLVYTTSDPHCTEVQHVATVIILTRSLPSCYKATRNRMLGSNGGLSYTGLTAGLSVAQIACLPQHLIRNAHATHSNHIRLNVNKYNMAIHISRAFSAFELCHLQTNIWLA